VGGGLSQKVCKIVQSMAVIQVFFLFVEKAIYPELQKNVMPPNLPPL